MSDPDATPVEDDAGQPATPGAPDPADTDHPTGADQAEENTKAESPS